MLDVLPPELLQHVYSFIPNLTFLARLVCKRMESNLPEADNLSFLLQVFARGEEELAEKLALKVVNEDAELACLSSGVWSFYGKLSLTKLSPQSLKALVSGSNVNVMKDVLLKGLVTKEEMEGEVITQDNLTLYSKLVTRPNVKLLIDLDAVSIFTFFRVKIANRPERLWRRICEKGSVKIASCLLNTCPPQFLFRREKLLEMCAHSPNIALYNMLRPKDFVGMNTEVCDRVCLGNHLQIVLDLLACGYTIKRVNFTLLLENASLEIIAYFWERGYASHLPAETLYYHAQRMEVFSWLLSRVSLPATIMHELLVYGRPEQIKMVLTKGSFVAREEYLPPLLDTYGLDCARVMSDRLPSISVNVWQRIRKKESLDYLCSRYPFPKQTYYNLLQRNRFDLCLHLLERGEPYPDDFDRTVKNLLKTTTREDVRIGLGKVLGLIQK